MKTFIFFILALAACFITLTVQQQEARSLSMRLEHSWLYIPYGFFRIMVFSDLLLNNNATENAATIQFMRDSISYYQTPDEEGIIPKVDLVVILGNAVNGTDWDGADMSYFEDRWDMIMQVIIENQLKISFTLGDLDTKGNLKDPKRIIRYLNSYGNLSMTYPTPTSIDGDSFYGLPVKRILCHQNVMQYAAYLMFLDSNTHSDCPQKQADKPENGFVSKQQINQAAAIVQKIRSSQPVIPNFFFSHQGFHELPSCLNDPEIDKVYSNNGGNQNVSCSIVDSNYLQKMILSHNKNLGFIAGKDLDNRYIISTPVNYTQIGRAGASNKSTGIKKRGAFIIELEEWSDPRDDKCQQQSVSVTYQGFIEEGDLKPFIPSQIKAQQRLKRSKISSECNRQSDQSTEYNNQADPMLRQQDEAQRSYSFEFANDSREQKRIEELRADI
ncbi:hypothetical protein FGO68_gene12589 [Halteria grandinella]|uniref:Uncharacterized protein n=1 Tax=Halteria grandinella TaxID=5974 RepID=A0A8J8NNK5_HALGN|nr:hypothetical protein FGO68_gene12589 [Halteria grandinella]